MASDTLLLRSEAPEITPRRVARPGDRPRTVLAVVATLVVVVGSAIVLVRPVSHNAVLYSLFLVMGAVSAFTLIHRKLVVPTELVVIWGLVLAVAVYGLILGGPNSGFQFTVLVWALAPTLWACVSAAATEWALRAFFWAAGAASLIVAGSIVAFVLGEAGTIPQLVPAFVVDQLGLGATFSGGASQARMYGLSSLVALGPIWVSSLFVRRDALLPPWWFRAVCAAAAFGAAYMSSRNAIVVVIVIAPLIALVSWLILRIPGKPIRVSLRATATVFGAAAIAAVVAFVMAPRLRTALDPLFTAFGAILSSTSTASSDPGSDTWIRADESDHLIAAWLRNPILGAGFGTRVPDYARTSERPWVLELQGHLLLFNLGLVGVLFVVAVGVAALVLVRRAARARPQLLPSFVVAVTAAAAMVIANATNPYLQAPGHMWAIYLPIAVSCAALRRARAGGSTP